MYSQKANIPLQDLDKEFLGVLTVGAISGLTAKLEPYIGAIIPVINLHC